MLVVFFGLTVFLLDMLFRDAAERSLREVLDAQMVALIAAADPDGPESVTPTARARDALRDAGLGPVRGDPLGERREHLALAVDHRHGRAFRTAARGRRAQFFFTHIAGTPIRLAVASRGIVWDDLHGQPARFTFSVASSLEAYEQQVASFRQQLVGWFVGLALLLVATLALLLRWLSQPCGAWNARSRKWRRARASSSAMAGRASWPRSPAISTRCSWASARA